MKGRKVFLTGHTGFKGSWLSLWLHQLGAKVTGYALDPPTTPSNYAASNVREVLAAEHLADVRDRETLGAALKAAEPDVVIHMAAQALVRTSYEEPVETWDVNVMGTVAVLDAVRQLGQPCAVIVVTSDKCYENRKQVWGYREDDAMGGYDPYSASKGAAELVTASYRRSFFDPARVAEHGVKLASARAGNVIGGGDWGAYRIVPDLVSAASSGEVLGLRSPQAVRPWQHVLEPLSGYLTLAVRMLASDAPFLQDGWNFGPLPGQEATVQVLAEQFFGAWGSGSWKDVSDPNQPHEASVLRLCVDKANAELDWRPRWDCAETVRRTALWYKEHLTAPKAMREACYRDIAAFQDRDPGRTDG